MGNKIKYTCSICKKNTITKIHGTNCDIFNQDKEAWEDGTVGKITFGYGSEHDMTTFYLGICDGCITELSNNGLATDLSKINK